MHESFTPSVVPPEERDGQALCFAFKGDQLLVHLQEGKAQIPRLSRLAELGLEIVREHYLGHSREQGPCYAVELPAECTAPAGAVFHGLRALWSRLDEELFWIGGRAVQIVAWARDHQYCGRCAAPTRPAAKERALVCPQCGLTSFPRLSPAIIALVERGRQFLLARNHRFPPGRYSIIAGFVEPGETLEEAVCREIREEVGIAVKNIRYFASQPWPFPNSLMLGFVAEYDSGEIEIDGEELADAGWYTPDNLPDLPDGISISRQLIDWFLHRHART